jgi:hypothetical protein
LYSVQSNLGNLFQVFNKYICGIILRFRVPGRKKISQKQYMQGRLFCLLLTMTGVIVCCRTIIPPIRTAVGCRGREPLLSQSTAKIIPMCEER